MKEIKKETETKKGWNKESNKKTLKTREGMQGRTFKARATKQSKNENSQQNYQILY